MPQHARRRRTRILFSAIFAATAAGGLSIPRASADPLVNIEMLGWDLTQLGPAPSNALTYQPSVQVNAGDTVVYSILTFLSPVGTTNSNSDPLFPTGHTIASKSSVDGINSLTFDAYELAADQIQVDFKNAIPGVSISSPAQGMSLFNGPGGNQNTNTQNWTAGAGANGGQLGHLSSFNLPGARTGPSNDLLLIRPVTTPGKFFGQNSTQAGALLGTGLFVVSSTGTAAPSTVKMRYAPTTDGGSSGGFQINNGTDNNNLSDLVEAGADPFTHYIGLNLTSPLVPATTWNADASGTWSQAANWTGGSPNAANAFAVFGSTITAPRQVTIDAPTTVGFLVFSSTASYTLTGPGTLTLSGIGGVGAITVSAGNHEIAAPMSLPADSGINSSPVGSVLTLSGSISGAGGLTMAGAGTLILSGSNTYLGGTVLGAGAVQINNDSNLGDPAGPLTFAGGTLRTSAGLSTARSISLANTALIDTNGFDSTFTGIFSGTAGLTKSGAGAMVLAGSATYSGATTLSGGTLRAGAPAVFPPVSPFTLASGTTLDLNSFDQSIVSVTGSGSVALGSATLTVGTSGQSFTYAGSISGNGGFTKAGAGFVTITGNSSYTGPTHIAGGTLAVSTNTALGDGSAGNVLNLDAATLQTNAAVSLNQAVSLNSTASTLNTNNFSSTLVGNISGSGKLNKTGIGTLTLIGNNAYTGGTAISAGVLNLNNLSGSGTGSGPVTVTGATLAGTGTTGGLLTVNSTGHLAPGAGGAGTFSAAGGLTLASGAVLDYDLASTNTPGSTINDLLSVTGDLSLGTSLTFNLNAYQGDVANSTYKLLSYTGALTGSTTGWTIGAKNAPATHLYSFSLATPCEIDLIIATSSILWTGAVNASWTAGGNWSTATKPTSTQDALFPSPVPATGATITLATGQAAKTLEFDDSYTLTGGSLAISAANISVAAGKTATLGTTLTGAGLTKVGAGMLILNNSNSYSGATNINGGTLQLGNINAIPTASAVTIVSGATLDLNSNDASFNSIAGNGSVALGAGTLTMVAGTEFPTTITLSASVQGSGNLTKAGPGTLILKGASSHSGFTTVAAGTLQANGANVFSPASSFFVASTLNLNSFNQTIGSLAGTGPVLLGSATLTTGANNGTTTFAGVISGSGNLIKTGAGNMTLTRANTYTGSTTVNSGELIVTGSIASSGGVNLNGGTFVNNGSASGTFTVNAGGTIKGSGIYNGPIVINSGGAISPGNSPGTITSNSGLINSGGIYNFDVRDANGPSGTGLDYWHILNQLAIASTSSSPFLIDPDTLNTSNTPGLADNFDPSQSYQWTLIHADTGITGFSPDDFAIDPSAFLNPLSGGSFSITESPNDLFLNFIPASPSGVPEPSTALLVLATSAIYLSRRKRPAFPQIALPKN